MDEITNLRAAPRVPIGYRIKVVTEDDMITFAAALNLSIGGLLLAFPPLFPVGCPCGVVIFLMDGELGKKVVARGTVVRSDPRGTAIQFMGGLEEESQLALVTLVESLRREGEDSLTIPS